MESAWERPIRSMAAGGIVTVDQMIGVYTGTNEYRFDGVRVLPYPKFVTELHAGKLFLLDMAGQIDQGYRFRVYRPLYVDLRMNEIVAVYSWLLNRTRARRLGDACGPVNAEYPFVER